MKTKKPKEMFRRVLGVNTNETRGRHSAWLVYYVAYSDGTTKTEKGPPIFDEEAAELGLYESLRHAAMANRVLERGLSDRDEKMRSRRKR